MKRLALLIWLCCSPVMAQDITSNLVLWWKLDETTGTTITDYSASGYNGTLEGDTAVQSVTSTTAETGAPITGINLAIAELVKTNSFVSDVAAPLTICCWWNRPTAGENDITYIWAVASSASATRYWDLLESATETLGVQRRNSLAGQGNDSDTNLTSSVDNDEWHHVAVVINTGYTTCDIYIDGVEEVDDYDLGSQVDMGTSFDEFLIGTWRHISTNNTAVAMSNVRIYQRALSAADIAADYNLIASPGITINPLTNSIPGIPVYDPTGD